MYGSDNNFLNCFCDYLSNIKQYVKSWNNVSTCLLVETGVSQGSIIGPSLFIVYISNLITQFGHNDSRITLYTDDTIQM